ncbi:sushi domain-containing protein 6 isoform X2 [Salminus brasiliensis]|uniref:sushi domain-containing protein 6 isoform X2 n=1 Tax=Salminus brasiliensis TaxID=930266 RepID=UPI003B82F854
MSAWRLPLWQCLQSALSYGFFILTALPDITTALSGQNCSHPLIQEHGGFYCKPSPCRGFPQKSHIYYFCEPGYVLPGRVHRSRCHNGNWFPSVPTCTLNPGHAKYEDRVTNSIPSVATTAVGVSIFLLTTTACMVVKSRLYPCQSQRRSSDQLDLVVDGLPVSLPTYEEAVYGSWGQRLPPLRGPTQLLLASAEHSPLSSLIQPEPSHRADASNRSSEVLPPPYEEVPLRAADGENEGEARASHIALSIEKDN